jgi:hypothetical protein
LLNVPTAKNGSWFLRSRRMKEYSEYTCKGNWSEDKRTQEVETMVYLNGIKACVILSSQPSHVAEL